MNRIGLYIVVPALLLIPNGCKGLEFSPSSFFSNFSLEELVKKNRSPSGMICTKGGTGGVADNFSIVGPGQSSSNKGESFSCEVSDDTFNEADFMASLKADVEQELNRSGATIIKQGSLEPRSFYFEYSERDVHGRIGIGGKRSEANYYSLEATLDEKSGGK